MKPVLVDTGPLVALIRKSDRDHARCAAYAGELRTPLLTTWPVITEAAWLLRANPKEVDALLKLVSDGYVAVDPLDPAAVEWIRAFYAKYADLGPQLADATLVYLAETLQISDVFTLDRRDFSVYRLTSGETLRIHPE